MSISFDKETETNLVVAAVVELLGKGLGDKLMHEAVAKIINTKVNRVGNTNYDGYNGSPNTPFLEFWFGEQVRTIMVRTVTNWVNDKKDAIEEAVEAELKVSDFAKRIVNDLSPKLGHYLKIDIKFENEPE